jgi:hypothetical protein
MKVNSLFNSLKVLRKLFNIMEYKYRVKRKKFWDQNLDFPFDLALTKPLPAAFYYQDDATIDQEED